MRVPLGGGSGQEILASDDIVGFNCSRTAGGPCILIEKQTKANVGSLLDPIKGRGPKVVEVAGYIMAGPVVSPNGQHIAFVFSSTLHNRIRIVDLHGATEEEITVASAQNLGSLDWSADGTGFFSEDTQPGGHTFALRSA